MYYLRIVCRVSGIEVFFWFNAHYQDRLLVRDRNHHLNLLALCRDLGGQGASPLFRMDE